MWVGLWYTTQPLPFPISPISRAPAPVNNFRSALLCFATVTLLAQWSYCFKIWRSLGRARDTPHFLHFLMNMPQDPIMNQLTLSSPVITMCTICFITIKLCILPTECICVVHKVLTINRDWFSNSVNRLIFIAETYSVSADHSGRTV
jgi:hypothetical protein